MPSSDFSVTPIRFGIVLPNRATPGSAAHDLFYEAGALPLVIAPGETVEVKTGLMVTTLPKDGFMSVHAKSGLFVKREINVKEMKFYLGEEVVVFLTNLNQERSYTLNPRDKMAQLICRPCDTEEEIFYLCKYGRETSNTKIDTILANERGTFGTTNCINPGTFGLVKHDRSTRSKNRLAEKALAGVIDSDYEDVLYLCYHRSANAPVSSNGARMFIYKYDQDVYLDGKKPSTVRSGGFGSTGFY
ncbi:putative deoxyuridine 5'-triphosphate nucleotidohydrolase [Abalone herpesvirus Victoria/AUS/2009]|uniref:AbHVp008 n=2 Tax=Aurivirus haliotidmalaco1 TaxID=3050290 RepID=E0ADI1_9VIRU|nr:putative deoxyuridine 5'-triphosphate nucleotidohydrolase [Abalone herpesvirus Victoria/AUS/2009]ADL16654.1 AbHVp008 [Abalone herpesvirus Victoria/AUS/2007]AET13864.1 tc_p025 [Abalone herpesvirus Taiwan/2004]AFU90044.1 putative deoxyuridine 5'-triphosphate nucleotidohydrolase [Abalone herpesvirus Victoria/AUS/2009]UCX57020.1 ORF30 [Haliotid herpesvirus 1]